MYFFLNRLCFWLLFHNTLNAFHLYCAVSFKWGSEGSIPPDQGTGAHFQLELSCYALLCKYSFVALIRFCKLKTVCCMWISVQLLSSHRAIILSWLSGCLSNLGDIQTECLSYEHHTWHVLYVYVSNSGSLESKSVPDTISYCEVLVLFSKNWWSNSGNFIILSVIIFSFTVICYMSYVYRPFPSFQKL